MNKFPSFRVLVVDDEALIRWSLVETLSDAGVSVAEASDGQSAVRTLTNGGPFDVVVLDYRLPDSNDLNLLATIRRLSPRTAVVMMTAFGAPEISSSALELGAYRVVAKPFDVHQMADLVFEAHDSAAAGSRVASVGGRVGSIRRRAMVEQLFAALFVVTLVALVAAPIIGVLLLALPRRKVERTALTSQIHAHV